MKHLPGCAGVQNRARPRSLRLIGSRCECAEHFRKLEEWKQWLLSDDGKARMQELVKKIKEEPDNE